MATDFSPEALRARFQELTKKHDQIRAKSDPLREKRDQQVQKARAEEDKLNAQIAKAEAGLYENEMERAAVARALGGRTSG